MAEVDAGGRLVFANQLRGLAALAVVLAHLGGVFVLMGPFVAWITSMPEVHAGHPAMLALTGGLGINLGAFGVSVFFLISGFVIPFSLRGQRAGPFLLARALRIYPTLWAALAVEWLLVRTQSGLSGRGMVFGPLDYLENALLVNAALGGNFVDLVNWTLSVEVMFYLLMACLRGPVLRGRMLPFFAMSLAAIAVAAAWSHGLLPVDRHLAVEPMYVGYMLIGTVFHHHLTGRIGTVRAAAAMLALGLLFALGWRLGPIAAELPGVGLNYLYGYAAFALAYRCRRLFRPVRWLDALAAVSYPLYLLHSIVGYSVMAAAMHLLGLPYAAALPLGLAAALLLATALHVAVELPTTALGRRLTRRLSAAGAASAPAPLTPRLDTMR